MLVQHILLYHLYVYTAAVTQNQIKILTKLDILTKNNDFSLQLWCRLYIGSLGG